jgi:hypothetical protein
VSGDDLDAGQNELLTLVMSLPPDVRRVKLLSAAKAALMLDCSVSTLEKRRKRREPPPPAPNWSGGRKGEEVKYLASTLVEFITGTPISQVSPFPVGEHLPIAVNSAASRTRGMGTSGIRRHILRFGAVPEVTDDDAVWPFFVDPEGLVIAPCWENALLTADMFLDDRFEVSWMDWVAALAGVWVDEAARQHWLMVAEEESPGLCQSVDESRRAKLLAL